MASITSVDKELLRTLTVDTWSFPSGYFTPEIYARLDVENLIISKFEGDDIFFKLTKKGEELLRDDCKVISIGLHDGR